MESPSTTGKEDAARRQLGTALALFIDDLDPVSVQCLACGGGEIAETLVKVGGGSPFSEHALSSMPDLTPGELGRLRNQYWNAFKHSTARNGKPRDDQAILDSFDDSKNDHALFIGWLDLGEALKKMPIEAQVFQVWYYSLYPEKLDPNFDSEEFQKLFPRLKEIPKNAQKALLRKVIKRSRANSAVMTDSRTDRRKLIMK